MKKEVVIVLLVTIILAFLGLGFTAMSINPSFTIPEWVPMAFFIASGITLIILIIYIIATKSKKETLNNDVEKILERLKTEQDSYRKEKIEYRKEQLNKRVIPDKLLELDGYLTQCINQQDMTFDQMKILAPKIFKWYDWIRLLIVLIIYSRPFLVKIFKNSLIKFVIHFSSKFNLALSEIGLGTIPIVEKDNNYKKLYGEIVGLQSGLPIYITNKIHRNIMLSIPINSLRILNPKNSFWQDFESKSLLGSRTTVVKNSFNLLIMPVDNSLTTLRGEVSSDIEKYFEGNN